jgi:hypothetical protein
MKKHPKVDALEVKPQAKKQKQQRSIIHAKYLAEEMESKVVLLKNNSDS